MTEDAGVRKEAKKLSTKLRGVGMVRPVTLNLPAPWIGNISGAPGPQCSFSWAWRDGAFRLKYRNSLCVEHKPPGGSIEREVL